MNHLLLDSHICLRVHPLHLAFVKVMDARVKPAHEFFQMSGFEKIRP